MQDVLPTEFAFIGVGWDKVVFAKANRQGILMWKSYCPRYIGYHWTTQNSILEVCGNRSSSAVMSGNARGVCHIGARVEGFFCTQFGQWGAFRSWSVSRESAVKCHLRVTGTVDTNIHSRAGMERPNILIDGVACEKLRIRRISTCY